MEGWGGGVVPNKESCNFLSKDLRPEYSKGTVNTTYWAPTQVSVTV